MLPLDSLLHRLESAGFHLSPADRLRVLQLLDAMGREYLENPRKLRLLLAPILARSAAEQAKFYEVFDQWLPQPVVSQEPPPQKPSVRKNYRWWWIGLGVLILVALAWGQWQRNNQSRQSVFNEDIEGDLTGPKATGTENATLEYPAEKDVFRPRLPIIELQLAEELRTPKPSWLAWAILLFFSCAACAFWWRWWRHAVQKPLQKSTARQGNSTASGAIADAPPYTIPFHGQETYIRTGRAQYRLADALRQRQQGEHPFMDVSASVQATLDRGGYPTLRFQMRRQPADYLCIIDEPHRQSHLTRLFRFFAEHVRGQDVALEIFQASSSLDRFWNAQYPAGLTLEQLQRLFPAHRLLLFGTAHSLLDQAAAGQARVRPEMATAFKRWRQRLLFSPHAPATWTFEERALYELFTIFPATLQGMQDAAQHIEANIGISADDEAPPAFARWRERAQQRASEQHDHRYTRWRDAADHEDYLAGRPDLLRWLQALAVYPSPTWEITLAIGQGLEKQGVVVRPDDLLILSRIEWLQTGRMPHQLREELLADLPPETETAARHATIAALEAARAEAGNGFAGLELDIHVAIQEFALQPDDAQKQEALRLLFETGRVNKTQEQVANAALARHLKRQYSGAKSAVMPEVPTARDFLSLGQPASPETTNAEADPRWTAISRTRKLCVRTIAAGSTVVALLMMVQLIGGRLDGIESTTMQWLLWALIPANLALWGSYWVKSVRQLLIRRSFHRVLMGATTVYAFVVLATLLASPFVLRNGDLSLQMYLQHALWWVLSTELFLVLSYGLAFYDKGFMKRDPAGNLSGMPETDKNSRDAIQFSVLAFGFAGAMFVWWLFTGWQVPEKQKRSLWHQDLIQMELTVDSAVVYNNQGVRAWEGKYDTLRAVQLFKQAMRQNWDPVVGLINETDTWHGAGVKTAAVNLQQLYYNLAANALNTQFERLPLPTAALFSNQEYRNLLANHPDYDAAVLDTCIAKLRLLCRNFISPPPTTDMFHALGLAYLYRFQVDSAELYYQRILARDSTYFSNLNSARPNLETMLGRIFDRVLTVEKKTDAFGRLESTIYFQLKEAPASTCFLVALLLNKKGKVVNHVVTPFGPVTKGNNQTTFYLPDKLATPAFKSDSLLIKVYTTRSSPSPTQQYLTLKNTADSIRIKLPNLKGGPKMLFEWKEAYNFNWTSDRLNQIKDNKSVIVNILTQDNPPLTPAENAGISIVMDVNNERRKIPIDENGQGYFGEMPTIAAGEKIKFQLVAKNLVLVNSEQEYILDGKPIDLLVRRVKPLSPVEKIEGNRGGKSGLKSSLPGKSVQISVPDRDNDGIPDAEDKCPDQKGLFVYGGCPKKDPAQFTVYDSVQQLERRIAAFKSELFIVHFWATYHDPSSLNLHYFDKIGEQYPQNEVQVLLVSLDFKSQMDRKLIPYLEKLQVRPEVALFSDQDINVWIPRIHPGWDGGIPATFFFKKGTIGPPGAFFGDYKSYEDLQKDIEKYLPPRPKMGF